MDNSGINEEPKILLVEDDPKLGKTLSDVLKAKGYRPIAVLTGEEGIEATKEDDDLSLALIDLKLPDISGIEVLKGIKKNSPRTEVIILTAYASLESAMEAVNLGAFSYLQKPYDMERLLLDIRRALERKRAEEALRKAHDELELRVKERTAELEEANEQLKREINERKEAEKRVKNLELSALHRLFKQGKGYLIIEEKPDTSFKLFGKLIEYWFKGLLISRTHPSHVHEEYNNVKDVPITWLTHVKGENHVVPTNITQLSIAVKEFAENDVESVIMLEGLEYLIAQNGFEVILRFVESVTDIVTTSKCRLIMPFDARTLSEVELHRLERELNVMNAKEVQVLILD